MNILHVASFMGNIGDNINHGGFYKKLSSIGKFEITKYEIRETFWGDKSFNLDFVDLCNKHDAVIIGGGNFFELWVDKSRTGCSIDLPPELLKEIKVPIVFNSLGVDPGQGVSTENLKKFKRFIDSCISLENVYLSVRNDGAIDNITKYLGKEYKKHFYSIADAGLFYESKNKNKNTHPELSVKRKNILIQIAGDMNDVRFDQKISDINEDQFIEGLVEVIEKLSIKYNVILCPHIFKDLEIINKILDNLNDKVRRNNVTVSACIQGDEGADYLFNLYKNVDLNIAMRFHSNIISLAQEKPTIALVNYIQIENLYKDIGESKFVVDVRRINFKNNLLEKIKLFEENQSELKISTTYLQNKTAAYDQYINDVFSKIFKNVNK